MKLSITSCRQMLAGAAFAVPLSAATAVSADEITIASWVGPKNIMNAAGLEPFKGWVEGQGFDTKFFTGGSLYTTKSIFSGLKDGVVDLGVLSYTFFPAELSNGALIAEIGMMSENSLAAAAAAIEYQLLECPDCLAEFDDNNMVYIAGHATSTYAIISAEPVREASDLEGKTMRVAGGSWAEWARFAGGVDINIPGGEVFDALSKGSIDVAIYSASALESFSLWDVAKYVTTADLGAVASVGTFVFNKGFWADLTPEQRELFAEEALRRAVDVTIGYETEVDRVLALAPEHGVEVIPISESIQAQKAEYLKAAVGQAKDRARDNLRIEGGDEKVERLVRLNEKWDGLVGKSTTAEEAVSLLKREVFDKIDFATYAVD